MFFDVHRDRNERFFEEFTGNLYLFFTFVTNAIVYDIISPSILNRIGGAYHGKSHDTIELGL